MVDFGFQRSRVQSSAGAPFVVALSKSHFHSSWGNGQKLIDSVNSKKKKKKKKKICHMYIVINLCSVSFVSVTYLLHMCNTYFAPFIFTACHRRRYDIPPILMAYVLHTFYKLLWRMYDIQGVL